ncbi:MAG: hypothetical protein ACRDL0_11615, partial [Thermoleophilaceae bacterium]
MPDLPGDAVLDPLQPLRLVEVPDKIGGSVPPVEGLRSAPRPSAGSPPGTHGGIPWSPTTFGPAGEPAASSGAVSSAAGPRTGSSIPIGYPQPVEDSDDRRLLALDSPQARGGPEPGAIPPEFEPAPPSEGLEPDDIPPEFEPAPPSEGLEPGAIPSEFDLARPDEGLAHEHVGSSIEHVGHRLPESPVHRQAFGPVGDPSNAPVGGSPQAVIGDSPDPGAGESPRRAVGDTPPPTASFVPTPAFDAPRPPAIGDRPQPPLGQSPAGADAPVAPTRPDGSPVPPPDILRDAGPGWKPLDPDNPGGPGYREVFGKPGQWVFCGGSGCVAAPDARAVDGSGLPAKDTGMLEEPDVTLSAAYLRWLDLMESLAKIIQGKYELKWIEARELRDLTVRWGDLTVADKATRWGGDLTLEERARKIEELLPALSPAARHGADVAGEAQLERGLEALVRDLDSGASGAGQRRHEAEAIRDALTGAVQRKPVLTGRATHVPALGPVALSPAGARRLAEQHGYRVDRVVRVTGGRFELTAEWSNPNHGLLPMDAAVGSPAERASAAKEWLADLVTRLLTRGEARVLYLRAHGMSTDQIAGALGRPFDEVATTRWDAARKLRFALGARQVAEALGDALRQAAGARPAVAGDITPVPATLARAPSNQERLAAALTKLVRLHEQLARDLRARGHSSSEVAQGIVRSLQEGDPVWRDLLDELRSSPGTSRLLDELLGRAVTLPWALEAATRARVVDASGFWYRSPLEWAIERTFMRLDKRVLKLDELVEALARRRVPKGFAAWSAQELAQLLPGMLSVDSLDVGEGFVIWRGAPDSQRTSSEPQPVEIDTDVLMGHGAGTELKRDLDQAARLRPGERLVLYGDVRGGQPILAGGLPLGRVLGLVRDHPAVELVGSVRVTGDNFKLVLRRVELPPPAEPPAPISTPAAAPAAAGVGEAPEGTLLGQVEETQRLVEAEDLRAAIDALQLVIDGAVVIRLLATEAPEWAASADAFWSVAAQAHEVLSDIAGLPPALRALETDWASAPSSRSEQSERWRFLMARLLGLAAVLSAAGGIVAAATGAGNGAGSRAPRPGGTNEPLGPREAETSYVTRRDGTTWMPPPARESVTSADPPNTEPTRGGAPTGREVDRHGGHAGALQKRDLDTEQRMRRDAALTDFVNVAWQFENTESLSFGKGLWGVAFRRAGGTDGLHELFALGSRPEALVLEVARRVLVDHFRIDEDLIDGLEEWSTPATDGRPDILLVIHDRIEPIRALGTGPLLGGHAMSQHFAGASPAVDHHTDRAQTLKTIAAAETAAVRRVLTTLEGIAEELRGRTAEMATQLEAMEARLAAEVEEALLELPMLIALAVGVWGTQLERQRARLGQLELLAQELRAASGYADVVTVLEERAALAWRVQEIVNEAAGVDFDPLGAESADWWLNLYRQLRTIVAGEQYYFLSTNRYLLSEEHINRPGIPYAKPYEHPARGPAGLRRLLPGSFGRGAPGDALPWRRFFGVGLTRPVTHEVTRDGVTSATVTWGWRAFRWRVGRVIGRALRVHRSDSNASTRLPGRGSRPDGTQGAGPAGGEPLERGETTPPSVLVFSENPSRPDAAVLGLWEAGRWVDAPLADHVAGWVAMRGGVSGMLEDQALLGEIARLVRPGGFLQVTLPSELEPSKEDIELRRVTRDAVEAHGFSLIFVARNAEAAGLEVGRWADLVFLREGDGPPAPEAGEALGSPAQGTASDSADRTGGESGSGSPGAGGGSGSSGKPPVSAHPERAPGLGPARLSQVLRGALHRIRPPRGAAHRARGPPRVAATVLAAVGLGVAAAVLAPALPVGAETSAASPPRTVAYAAPAAPAPPSPDEYPELYGPLPTLKQVDANAFEISRPGESYWAAARGIVAAWRGLQTEQVPSVDREVGRVWVQLLARNPSPEPDVVRIGDRFEGPTETPETPSLSIFLAQRAAAEARTAAAAARAQA